MTLNRRDFIGAVIASTSMSALGASLVPGETPAATSGAASRQGAWLRNGLIDAGGNHEPQIFIVRRGGQRRDVAQTSKYELSEELIRKLHSQGIEVFHTSLYKGFGMAAEKEGMERTRQAVAVAHSYGMKADTYVQWGSLMYETFFAEEPRAEHWIQRDEAGKPIMLCYGYQQSFRYQPCFANQEYIDYLKKVIHYAIVEVKTDFIHLDNFGLNSEPDSCHCPQCVNGFRKFLRTKYTAELLRERLGFENVSYVLPPLWNRDNPPDKMEVINDPIFQEWVDFRCQFLADALRQISEYAKSLNPEVAMEINPGGITGINNTWEAGVDHARLLKFTQAFWSEEGDPPEFTADGRLISKIRSFKLARTYNNVLLTPMPNGAVSLAESLAFNQTPGCFGSDPLLPEILNYIDFYRKNRGLYLDSEDISPVAVLRSYASLTYHNANAQLSAILVEQALIQSRIPFSLVFDEHLRDLSAYNVLILPNSECLSDEQLTLIRRYVDQGGGLVVTEQAGLYDEWRRLRVQPGLSELVDHQPTGSSYQEEVKPTSPIAGATLRKQVGRGRVAYLPAVQFDGPLPPAIPGFEITNTFWKRPKNWKEIMDAISWAANDPLPFVVDGPDYLVANYTWQPKNRRYLIHLVNYDVANKPSIGEISIRVNSLPRLASSQITLYSPESKEPRTLNFTSSGSAINFTVPGIATYALVAIQQ